MASIWFWAGLGCLGVVIGYQITRQLLGIFNDMENNKSVGLDIATVSIEIILLAAGFFTIISAGPKLKGDSIDLHAPEIVLETPEVTEVQLEKERTVNELKEEKEQTKKQVNKEIESLESMRKFKEELEKR